MIDAIKLVAVRVSEPARALSFFCESLGFRLLTDQPSDQVGRWIELEVGNGGTRLALIAADGGPSANPSPTISFTARNLPETCRALVEAGVDFVEPLTRQSWGQVAVFRDRDGNHFALSSRR